MCLRRMFLSLRKLRVLLEVFKQKHREGSNVVSNCTKPLEVETKCWKEGSLRGLKITPVVRIILNSQISICAQSAQDSSAREFDFCKGRTMESRMQKMMLCGGECFLTKRKRRILGAQAKLMFKT